VATASGGEKGGGSALTALGAELVLRYRALEHETAIAVRRKLRSVLRAS
jgi:molybdate transport repressor ModE-like protein